ncbi:MAG: response regulator transcription factor [Bryobacterales bacterium]|nr:response regulator transcription factor [Bryobacterales bacterium]
MAVLVIDDDEELCGLLAKVFAQAGLEARFTHRGDEGLHLALQGAHELVVLDVMLPGLDGFEVLRRLRKASDAPVLMLSARGDDVDRIVGLEIGADDYLPKPFHPKELVARIRAILRRSSGAGAEGRRVLSAGGVTLDLGARAARCQDRGLELTTTEFDVLRLLMESAGRVLSRDALLEKLVGREGGPFDRSIDMHVSHLRKKMGDCARRIVTVRGVGYQFAVPQERPS